MKRGIGIIAAALLTTSIYSQNYSTYPDLNDQSKSVQELTPDTSQSRQSEGLFAREDVDSGVKDQDQTSGLSEKNRDDNADRNDLSAQKQDRFDDERDGNLTNDRDETPDMIYEEWIFERPDVGAPAGNESGSATSDQQDNSSSWRDEQPLYNGTDSSTESGAPPSGVSGKMSKQDSSDCRTDGKDAQGSAPGTVKGSGSARDSDEKFHINRGTDGSYHFNREDEDSRGSVGSSSSSPNDYGERSSEQSSEPGVSVKPETSSSSSSDNSAATLPPDF